MKKFFSFVLFVIFSATCFIIPFSLPAYASLGDLISFASDTVLSYVTNQISNYNDYIQKRTEAARGFYFYYIVNNKLACSVTEFDSSGHKFTDEYLKYYWDVYIQGTNSDAFDYDGKPFYFPDGDIFVQAAGCTDPYDLCFIAFREGIACDGSNANLANKFFNNFKNYYNSYLARYLLEQGETATDPNPGKSGLDIAPAYVTSEELVEGIEKDNSVFSPKGELSKISYRTDETFQKYINFPTTARTDYYKPFIVDNNNFVHVGSTTSNSLYFVFFYKDTNEYVSKYQFRLFFDSRAVEADDGTKDFVTYPRLQIWSNVDGTPSEPIDFLDGTVDCSEYKYYYLSLSYSSNYFTLYGFKTYSDYLNNRYGYAFSKQAFTNYYDELFRSDFSSSVKYTEKLTGHTSHSFKGSYSYHDKTCSCPLGGKDDIGLYVSAHPIEFTYADIDISKIPTGQIVTINGDTIYNYTITNPETGDSSKFGDYITNNYSYITNNYGGDSGGSGVGGNVTVGGSIDVGGSVGVDITVSVPDININVNGNGGAGGNSSLPDTDLVENLPEAPSGFIDYTASLFSFLPAEILSLLIAGLAAAIFCRIWGR